MAMSILQTNLLAAKKAYKSLLLSRSEHETKLIQKSTFGLSILAPTFPEPVFIKAQREYSFSEENHRIFLFYYLLGELDNQCLGS